MSLYNTGFGDHYSESRTAEDFIARPDGLGEIPEPTTLLLMAGGSLIMLRGKRKKVRMLIS